VACLRRRRGTILGSVAPRACSGMAERTLTRRDVETIRKAYRGRKSEVNDIIVCLCDALLERMPEETPTV